MKFDMNRPTDPQTAEEINECSTPDGLRRWLTRLAYRDGHPLIAQVFRLAEARGSSGEDKYLILAFEALKRMEHYENLALTRAMLEPMAPVVFPRYAPNPDTKP